MSCTLNPCCPPALGFTYCSNVNWLLVFLVDKSPTITATGHRGVRPLASSRWHSDCFTRCFPYSFLFGTHSSLNPACMSAALSIIEQRRGLGPGVPFQTVNLERALTKSCFKYVPKLSSDVFCYESVCHVPKAEAAASARPLHSSVAHIFAYFQSLFRWSFGKALRAAQRTVTFFHSFSPPPSAVTRCFVPARSLMLLRMPANSFIHSFSASLSSHLLAMRFQKRLARSAGIIAS